MAVTYSTAVKTAVRTALLGEIDSGSAVSTAYIKILNDDNELLARLPLTYPSGTVNGSGQLVFDVSNARDDAAETSPLDRVATQAIVYNRDNEECLNATVISGSAPSANNFVLTSTTVASGQPVELVSATIG